MSLPNTTVKTFLLQLLFITILVTNSFAQDYEKLYKSAWVRIKSEKADGSRIVERGQRHDTYQRLKFIKPEKANEQPSVYVSDIQHENITEGEYTLHLSSDKLRFKKKIKRSSYSMQVQYNFQLDELTDSVLVMTSILTSGSYGVRDYYIPEHEWLPLLLTSKLINLKGDTIYSNNFLFPSYEEEGLTGELSKKLSFVKLGETRNGEVSGRFIVTPEGKIIHPSVSSMVGVDEKYRSRILNVLAAIESKWELPKSAKPLFYNLDFMLIFDSRATDGNYFSSINMIDPVNVPLYPKLPYEEALQAYRLYQDGQRLLLKKKLDAAIDKFNQSLAIDNLLIDAYYARASAYYEQKKLSESCSDWKVLSDLGQIEGMKLYSGQCLKE